MTFDEAHRAIKRGQLAALTEAIPRDLSPNEEYLKTGTSLLILAAREGNTAIARFLIDQGARVNHMDNAGWTALSMAAHHGHIPFMKVLLEAGASLLGRPMGWEMQFWLRKTTGLKSTTIDAILKLLKDCVYLEASHNAQH
jgi:ankyrin repeat protein